jgi:hypothetical protein
VVHELKVWPDYFPRLADGSKTFEIRKDDRGFQAGDELVLRPFDPDLNDDCGDESCWKYWRNPRYPVLRFRVGFVAKGTLFGLELGEYAVLSLLPMDEAKERSDAVAGTITTIATKEVAR